MWLLKFLPNWIFYGILLAGLAGLASTYLMKFIPFVYIYRQTIQLASVGAIVVGTFMSGAIYDNNAWEARVHEMEDKVKVAEQQSIEANNKNDTKTQQAKTKVVEKQVIVKQYIDREVAKYNDQCVIPKEFIKALNDATELSK